MSELDKCANKTTTTLRVHTTSRHVPHTEGRVLRSLWPAPYVACPGQPYVRRMRVIATGCGHTRQARAYSRLSKNSIYYGALSQQEIKNTNQKMDNNQATISRLRDLPEWLEEFTDNLEDTEVSALATLPMTQIRTVLRKWQAGSTVFILFSTKTEIAKHASALAKQYDLITADHTSAQ